MLESRVPLDVQVGKKLDQWFGWKADSAHELSTIVRNGVDPDIINKLLNHGFSNQDLKWVINPRTLRHRLQKKEMLTLDEAAKAVRVARLTAQAEVIFSDPEKAERWLSKPKKNLNGQTPKEAMQDEFGATLVEQLLRKIDGGFY